VYGRNLDDAGPDREQQIQDVLPPVEELPPVRQVGEHPDDDLDVESERERKLTLVQDLRMHVRDVDSARRLQNKRC
jgi:hypothetical protein